MLLAKGADLTDEALDGDARASTGARSRSKTVRTRWRSSSPSSRTWSASAKSTSDEKIERLSRGDELPPGVIKMVKVYVAIKRKLQVGDKMAGRHGNKGVVSRILPEEDMPYLAGRHAGRHRAQPARRSEPHERRSDPRDPPRLGGPSARASSSARWSNRSSARTSVKQKLARRSTPATRTFVKVIESLSDDEADDLARKLEARRALRDAGVRRRERRRNQGSSGARGLADAAVRPILFDGRTGEAFDQDVTVGIMYMLKLHHLVDDKIHARSIGPYSLVTQQPLGGKAQFGGQRLGEMEVWAMEAYGAAYALQEFLTVKSDDVQGRTRMYESIVKGDYALEAGLPECFNVLIKELQVAVPERRADRGAASSARGRSTAAEE